MSRDYTVLWTIDLPTPRSIGLGSEMLPWPAPDEPWPNTRIRREALGYPDTHYPLDFVIGFSSSTLRHELSKKQAKALADRAVVREMSVQNNNDFAVLLADAGDGVCCDEEGGVLFPSKHGKPDPARAQRRLAATLWANLNPRPTTACERIVDAAATGDPTALAVIDAWAPDYYSRPNLGVRYMKHDRALCERIWQRAKEKPEQAALLLRALANHAYYPAARQPELAKVAKAAGVDLTYFIGQAKQDGAERMKWFKVREPLD
jgi:hypothetical protein